MRIPLGFLEPGMAQNLLQVVEASAVHHEMAGKRVPQIVKTVVVRQTCLFLSPLEVPVDVASSEDRFGSPPEISQFPPSYPPLAWAAKSVRNILI